VTQIQPEGTVDRIPTVRQLLARLHQVLIIAERNELEQEQGSVGAGDLLQRLLGDERFAWLRPMGRMVTKLDDLLAEAEKRGSPISERMARQALIDVRRVVSRTTGLQAGWRYADWVQRDPDIVLAHAALASALRSQPTAWAA